ncbi:hypothetical protein [Streptomyces sp. NPDC086787]|uniref:hypothetical protein n=1 Tax=Streptomyces sp. NPDC086787 TaxID=3365759 RepID=UPI003830A900
MELRAVVARGIRLGALIGAWPAGILGCGCLVGVVVYLVGGVWGTVRVLLAVGAAAVLVSMAVGLALGATAGLVLAVAPRRALVRGWARGLLAGSVAGVLLLAFVVTSLTVVCDWPLADYRPSTVALLCLAPLVAASVLAAHSGEILTGGAVQPLTATDHRRQA